MKKGKKNEKVDRKMKIKEKGRESGKGKKKWTGRRKEGKLRMGKWKGRSKSNTNLKNLKKEKRKGKVLRKKK